MNYEPASPIEGVVYPRPADLARWTGMGALEPTTLAQAFRQSAARNADRVALIWTEGALSYRQLDAQSDKVAAGLLGLGLEPLDRVMFQLTNTPEAIVAHVACWKASLIPVCTLSLHREAEIGYLARFSGARAHLIENESDKFDFHAFALKMQAEVPSLEFIVSTRGTAGPGAVDMAEFDDIAPETARARLAQLPQDPWQVAAFQLSGGTTGVPKIIPRFNAEYVYNMRSVMSFKRWTEADRIFIPMPFAHNLNMGAGWGPAVLNGASVVATPRTDQNTIRDVHNQLHPTVMGAAKPIIMRMKAEIDAGRMDLSSLREIFTTDSADLVTQTMGVEGHHVFGMTEGTIMFTRSGDRDEVRYKTCGRPISDLDEVRLLEPGTERDVPVGQLGELAVRGPYTIRGYFNAPERNRETFTSDGAYRSGDLMRCHVIDGVSYYSFEGRLKDVVDRAGEKVNCEEVERVVAFHPAFADVAVVGMPSPTHGEKVCLFVVPSPGADLPDVAALGEFLKQAGLAIYKWPERIEPIAALPLTKVGKLDKAALRALIAAKLNDEAARSAVAS